ncbi:MAG: hypothetical protein AUJ49_01450 [Desulfovibrionaceae bacterium CG1_02_65_16]|nr:MAG: hypothetical protein AUJ49_01450 [Desulfovibrionaceae bacterium CG1_02_65_16]
MYEVLLDLSRCNACSGCAEICPEIFGWDDGPGRPYLKRQYATHDEVREAISLCPKRCIGIEGWKEEKY